MSTTCSPSTCGCPTRPSAAPGCGRGQPTSPTCWTRWPPGSADMMRARAVWACAELASGVHAEAASYPAEVAERLGADVCTLVEPMVAACWSDGTTLTESDRPLLGRLAGRRGARAGACCAASATVRRRRGALLVLRRGDDEPVERGRARRALRARPTPRHHGRPATGPPAGPRDRRAAARARRVPTRPRRLHHPRPEDTADGDRAQHRAAGVRQAAGGGGLTSGRRRSAGAPTDCPTSSTTCSRWPGRRRGHDGLIRGRPGADGARRVRPSRDRGDAAGGHLCRRLAGGAVGRRRPRTRSRGCSPTSSRTP